MVKICFALFSWIIKLAKIADFHINYYYYYCKNWTSIVFILGEDDDDEESERKGDYYKYNLHIFI